MQQEASKTNEEIVVLSEKNQALEEALANAREIRAQANAEVSSSRDRVRLLLFLLFFVVFLKHLGIFHIIFHYFFPSYIHLISPPPQIADIEASHRHTIATMEAEHAEKIQELEVCWLLHSH